MAQLHELLAAPAKAPKPLIESHDRTAPLIRGVVFGIYPKVPAELLPWYARALADADNTSAFAQRLDPVIHLVPEDRAKLALEAAVVRHLEHSALWLRAPELLAARWNAGGEDRDAAWRILGSAWPEHAQRIVELVTADRLPPELARPAVDVTTLRAAITRDTHHHQRHLLHDAVAREQLPALQLAKGLPWWTLTIEGCITHATSDADPRVRLAAYEALRSRDADVWAFAWLVHEAVFDPDPAVQEFGRKLGR